MVKVVRDYNLLLNLLIFNDVSDVNDVKDFYELWMVSL